LRRGAGRRGKADLSAPAANGARLQAGPVGPGAAHRRARVAPLVAAAPCSARGRRGPHQRLDRLPRRQHLDHAGGFVGESRRAHGCGRRRREGGGGGGGRRRGCEGAAAGSPLQAARGAGSTQRRQRAVRLPGPHLGAGPAAAQRGARAAGAAARAPPAAATAALLRGCRLLQRRPWSLATATSLRASGLGAGVISARGF
jgi:hypothetical protein